EFDRDEAQPGYHLAHAVDLALWYRHPTYKDPLGCRDSVANATVAQMRWMQHVYYVPNNSALFVVGDVRHDEVFRLAEREYGAWQRGPDPFVAHPLVEHPPLPGSAAVLVEQPVQNATVTFAWHGPSTATDLKGTRVADLFSAALNLEDSRLRHALVDSGLASDVGMSYATLQNTGEIDLTIETTPDKVLDAVRAARREMADWGLATYFSGSQWESARTQLSVGDMYDRENVSQFSHTLSYWWAVAGLHGYLDYLPAIGALTPADGAAYAARYLVGKPAVLGVMVGGEAARQYGITPAALQQLMEGVPATSTPRKPVSSVNCPGRPGGFAVHTHAVGRSDRTPSPDLLTPASAGRLTSVFAAPLRERPVDPTPSGGLESFTVDGIPVLLRCDPCSPVVAASLYLQGGSMNLTPQTQGIEELASAVALRGAADGMSREERARRLDGMGSVVGVLSLADDTHLDLKCVPGFFDESWRLFTATLTAPHFETGDFALYQRRQLQAIQSQRERPDDEVARLSQLAFFAGHPYGLRQIGIEEVVSSLTAGQAADYWKALVVKSRLLLVVVGNIDRSRLQAAVQAHLGHLPAGAYRSVTPAPLPPRPARLTTSARDLPTTYVEGLFPAPAPGDADYAAASVALQVLNHRLFEEIRTRRNLAYAVYAGLSARKANYGVLYVTSTRPAEAVRIMQEQVERLACEPLSEDALCEEVEGFITRYYLSMETSEAQAGQYGWSQITAGDWRHAVNFVPQVEQVTPAQVQAAARRCIHGIQWAVLGDTANLDTASFTF
ncbi:MAG: M16 family metallopeptidase, partial [Candidatus Xenobia bacterium]